MNVLVLGGRGFIGRHVVRALKARGHKVIIGSRGNPCGDAGMRQVRMQHMTGVDTWTEVLHGIDAVVNTVGILRERFGETYDMVHHRAPATLAQVCAAQTIRLLHVSALGLSDDCRSRFLRSKLAGERAITLAGGMATIVRPSLVDGEGGFGAKWVRQVACWPVHVIPKDAVGKMAPIDADDLGAAIAILCEQRDNDAPREAELGGTAQLTMGEYLAAMRPPESHPVVSFSLPSWLARLASHMCDALHFSPYSFGHLELMRKDNLPRHNLLPELLGRSPRAVGWYQRETSNPLHIEIEFTKLR